MRKLIAGMQTSVDGKIEGPEGYADWVESWADNYGLMRAIVHRQECAHSDAVPNDLLNDVPAGTDRQQNCRSDFACRFARKKDIQNGANVCQYAFTLIDAAGGLQRGHLAHAVPRYSRRLQP